jgi:hypothetical protein
MGLGELSHGEKTNRFVRELAQKVVPIIGNWVVPFEEIRWYPFRKLAGPLSGNSAQALIPRTSLWWELLSGEHSFLLG